MSRRAVRAVGAISAAAMASIYYLIGLGVLHVGTATDGTSDADFMLVFGLSAGSAFLLGAFLLAATDRRWLWILGVAFQLFVYVAYFSIAPNRIPSFELWGITLRIIQAPLLVALLYLSVTKVDTPAMPLLERT